MDDMFDLLSWFRFDSLDFLGRMRRKRIMLVGDSIMRSQWESLVCMVEAVLPKSRKTLTFDGPSMAFHALVIFTLLSYTSQCLSVLRSKVVF